MNKVLDKEIQNNVKVCVDQWIIFMNTNLKDIKQIEQMFPETLEFNNKTKIHISEAQVLVEKCNSYTLTVKDVEEHLASQRLHLFELDKINSLLSNKLIDDEDSACSMWLN
ncbi:hypothetical protein MHB54_27860 [Paenibacillus sp. FSL M7-0802]|uniref:hypothetical protein n=1 Tax=Paenibacillus sp. FSL M7-0802 TaxID=2921536 RepID=UPI0030FCA15E